MRNLRLGNNRKISDSQVKPVDVSKKIKNKAHLRVETDQSKNVSTEVETAVVSPRKRNYSSQTRYKTQVSNTFQRRSVSCKKKSTPNANFQQQKSARCLSTSFNKLVRSPQKHQIQQNHNPWGGPPIAKAYAKEQFIQTEKKSLVLLNNLKQDMQNKSVFATSKIKYKSKKLHIDQKTTKMKVRPLPDYAKFINGDATYNVGFDFSFLRNLGKADIQGVVDMSYFKVVQSIMLCVLDVLKDQTKTEEKAGYKLLKQYSLFYFGLFQKILVQFVIYFHYYKLIQLKVTKFFIQTRLYFLILGQSAANQPELIKKHKSIFLNVLSQILFIKRQFLPSAKNGGQQNTMVETFKILKNISIIERKIVLLQTSMEDLTNLVIHQPRMKSIKKQFQLFDRIQCLGGLQLQLLAQTQRIIGWNLYQLPPLPYLPQKKIEKPFTLVVTLTDTLIYYCKKQQAIVYRPFLGMFLSKIVEMFEVVIWSDEKKNFSDPIIDQIEKENRIFEYRLYGQHFSLKDGALTRDLSRIGRQTQKTLLLKSTQSQNTNFIQAFQRGQLQIQKFRGEQTDKKLLSIIVILEQINQKLTYNQPLGHILKKRPLSRVQEETEENHTISTHKQL